MITVNNRDKLEWKKGMTVQTLLDEMGYSYSLITVTVDGILVNDNEYDDFQIEDGADVTVFHLAHGG
ncbi:MAG: sulfur carrier protein ThiS [Candidatus Latescibacteria bacterium]|nr:sulfur carrier protein ThiS [bacterium]MBD3423978.1 sulfur carrier protein ThiS [Candidatus Latescibacterota bacterium]